VFWSSVFFAFGGVEAGSSMGDEIKNPRRVIPWAILVGGTVLAIGYIAGTGALLEALPSDAVGGPDGFVNGIHRRRLDIQSMVARKPRRASWFRSSQRWVHLRANDFAV